MHAAQLPGAQVNANGVEYITEVHVVWKSLNLATFHRVVLFITLQLQSCYICTYVHTCTCTCISGRLAGVNRISYMCVLHKYMYMYIHVDYTLHVVMMHMHVHVCTYLSSECAKLGDFLQRKA